MRITSLDNEEEVEELTREIQQKPDTPAAQRPSSEESLSVGDPQDTATASVSESGTSIVPSSPIL